MADGGALAGERENVLREGFDFGNSPREFREPPAHTTLVMTTTNGTRLMLTSPSHTLAYLMGRKEVRYDINKIKWIGTLTQDTSSCAASGSSGVTDIRQTLKRKEPLIVGATGADSSTAQHAYLLAHMFGYKLKVVTGYRGTARVRLAMRKGEVQAVCAFWASSALGAQHDDVVNGTLVPIVQMGTRPVPVFGKAPVVYDLARNDDERKMLRVVFGTTELSRPFAAPPHIPAMPLAALRGRRRCAGTPDRSCDAADRAQKRRSAAFPQRRSHPHRKAQAP